MKKNLLYLILIFCICAAFKSSAQSYTVTSIPYNPVSYDSGIAVVSPVDDIFGEVLGLGFDFYFFGEAKQQVVVGSNTILTFDTAWANQWCEYGLTNTGDLPSDTIPRSSIMFPYQDVDISEGGTIRHHVLNSPPDRKFVVSFKDVPYYACPQKTFTGQVILYEGSNIIEMFIENKDTCYWNEALAIMGIQNDNRTVAYWVPGRNRTVWTATYEGWRFTPPPITPQNLNRISGRLIADLDKNCITSGNDYGLRNKPVIFTKIGTNSVSYIYTDMQGYYSKLLEPGNYNFTTTNIANQLFNTACPVSGNFTKYFPGYNDSSDNNLFADTISQECTALNVSLFVSGETSVFDALGTCDTAYVRLRCSNVGIVNDSVELNLILNDSTQILNSQVPYVSGGINAYTFNLGWLAPGQDTIIEVQVRTGCDTIGTEYCFALDAQSVFPMQCSGYNTHSDICRFIGAPYDPNATYVSSALKMGADVKYLETYNDDEFYYTITFQNTGTAVAHNVKLEIPLSSRTLAPSVMPIDGSAMYSWLMLNNMLVVDFIGIELPDSNSNAVGSQGYFKFKLAQRSGNQAGDIIVHRASIYFDNNSPLLTNQAKVLIIDSAINTGFVNLTDENEVRIFPNPTDGVFEVMCKEAGSIKVCDIAGKSVTGNGLVAGVNLIDISQYPAGVYFLSIFTNRWSKTYKVLKK